MHNHQKKRNKKNQKNGKKLRHLIQIYTERCNHAIYISIFFQIEFIKKRHKLY